MCTCHQLTRSSAIHPLLRVPPSHSRAYSTIQTPKNLLQAALEPSQYKKSQLFDSQRSKPQKPNHIAPQTTSHTTPNQKIDIPIDPTTPDMISTAKEQQKRPQPRIERGTSPILKECEHSRVRKPEGRIIPLNHRGRWQPSRHIKLYSFIKSEACKELEEIMLDAC